MIARRPCRLPLSAAIVLAGVVLTGTLTGCLGRGPKVNEVYRVPTTPVVAEEVFCYRTLATPDCYAEPLFTPPNRLIGRAPLLVLRPVL